MTKKIEQSTLENLKFLCYDIVIGEMIDQETMSKVKHLVENRLNNGGYKIEKVKCDEENNPPDLVDSGQMKIEIWEEVMLGSSEKKIHTIIL